MSETPTWTEPDDDFGDDIDYGNNEAQGESPSRGRGKSKIIGAIVLVLIIALVAIVMILSNSNSNPANPGEPIVGLPPEGQVAQYLDALKMGDAEAAETVIHNINTSTLTTNPAIFASATDYISDYSIDAVSHSQDGLNQNVETTIVYGNGKKVTMIFEAIFSPKNNVWLLQQIQWPTLTFKMSLMDTFSINGVQIDVREERARVGASDVISIPAYPGTYRVSLTASDDFTAPAMMINTADDKPAIFDVTLSSQFKDKIMSKIRDWMFNCMREPPVTRGKACPNWMAPDPLVAYYSSVEWVDVSTPEYTIVPIEGNAVIATKGYGVVRADYLYTHINDPDTWISESDEFRYYPEISIIMDPHGPRLLFMHEGGKKANFPKVADTPGLRWR